MSDVLNTVVDKKAFQQVQELEEGLRGAHQALLAFMKDAGGANININAKSFKELDDQIKKSAQYQKQLNKHQSESDKIQKALENSRKSLAQALSKENKEIQANRLAAQQANKENKDLARISSTLAGAYARTSAQLNKMRGEYKDLAIRKQQGEKLTEKEIKQMQRLEKEVGDLDRKLKQVDADAGQFQRSVGNYGKAWGKAGNLIRSAVAAFGVYSAMDIARDIIEQVKQLDSLDRALVKVTGSQLDFNESLNFLIDLSEKSGVRIETLEKAYTKFYASARTTNLTLTQIRDIFESVSMAGASLGLSTEEITGAFRALEQMLSKGNVQAEEIRGQLGERLPGAFQILAKSMGLTTAQLNKQLELGNVIADEVLPKFAEELNKTFGVDSNSKIETLIASQNRLSNSWTEFVRGLSDSQGTISKVLMSVYGGLTKITDALKFINESTASKGQKQYNEVLEEQLSYYESMGDERAKQVAQYDQSLATSQINILEEELKVLKEKQTVLKSDEKWYLKNARAVYKNGQEIAATEIMIKRETARRNAAARQLIDHTDWLNKNTEAQEENANAGGRDDVNSVSAFPVQETKEYMEGTIAYYENLIKSAKEHQKTLATTSEEYKFLGEQIGALEDAVSIIDGTWSAEGFLKPTDAEKLEIDDFLNTEGIMKGMKSLSDVLGQDQQSLMMEFASQYEWDYEQFLKWSEKKMQQAEKEGEVKKEQVAEWLRVSSDIIYNVGQLFSAQSDRKIAKLEEEMAAQDAYYANAIEAEEGNAERQAELRAEQAREKEKLKKEAEKEREEAAKREKMFAAFDIAINTAAAIVQALPNVPLSIAIGAIGALQLATVLSQPVPKYAKGREDGPEELAITGDGGKQEVITDSKGRFKALTPKTPTLTYLSKGDKVFPDIPSFQEEYRYEDLKRASVMTSLQDQQQKLSSAEAQQNFNMNLLVGKIKSEIHEGFKNAKITNNNHNDNSSLANNIATAIRNQNLRDKI